MIRDCGNPFIDMYKTAREQIEAARASTDSMRIVLNPQLRLLMEQGSDRRRTNLPTAREVALFIPDEYSDSGHRDIVIAERTATGEEPRFHRISHNNAAYFPLHYVLFFPDGRPGWHWALRLRNDDHTRIQMRYSQRAWLRYHLFERANQYSVLLKGKRLFQQYIVDSWAVVDQNTLDFHRHNQNVIRADLYRGVADALTLEDGNLEAMGRRIVLPSSYTGGDRWMQQLYQDSMAIARHFGKPTMFITFTANPRWTEIIDAIGPNQRPEDRPDITVRVYYQKLRALLKDVKTIFGRYLGVVWTVEYQKRGLPHAHILLFLHREDSFMERARVDELICAELPDPAMDTDGSLRAIIEGQLSHGPCGSLNPNAPCMTDNPRGPGRYCAKKFPKSFQAETNVQDDGYPLYRRRQDGRTWTKRIGGREVQMDNS